MVEILSVSGDNHLGGDDFHQIMLENFLKEHGIYRENLTSTEEAVILKQAELCKRALTEQETATMTAVINGNTYQSVYDNQRLMEESASILMRIKKVLTHALRDGNFNVHDINMVVMVGGSSKMPLIQSYIQHLFKKAPVVTMNCDEIVARGVGLVCGVKERNESIKDYVLTDICPFTLGTSICNHADPDQPYMAPIVERNSTLPCSKVKRFWTSYDFQTELEIDILQGEKTYAKDNVSLGKVDVRVPRKRKGEESVDIRFTYDINGILIVDITVVSSGQKITKVISETMDEEDMRQKIEELAKLKIHPKDISENKYVLEKLQALYEEAPLSVREQIQSFIRYFDYLLTQQNMRQIRKYRQYLEHVIDQLENYDPFGDFFTMDEYEEDDDDWLNEEEEEDDDFIGEGSRKKWTN